MNPITSTFLAFLGPIGGPELIVIFIVLLILIGIPVAIVFIVLVIVNKKKKNSAAIENSDQTDQQ